MRQIIGLWIACGSLACGSSIVADPSANSGEAGSSSGGGSATSTETGVGGEPGTGGATVTSACAAYVDAKDGNGTVTFRFTNQTPQPIYLPGGCSKPTVQITSLGKDSLLNFSLETSCVQTCESLQTQPRFACDMCAPRAFVLEPGESLDVEWSGTALKAQQMPSACWSEINEPSTCEQTVVAPLGPYRVALPAFSACDGCECADGVCSGTPGGMEASPAMANFDYASEPLVEVVFDVCAFGCGD